MAASPKNFSYATKTIMMTPANTNEMMPCRSMASHCSVSKAHARRQSMWHRLSQEIARPALDRIRSKRWRRDPADREIAHLQQLRIEIAWGQLMMKRIRSVTSSGGFSTSFSRRSGCMAAKTVNGSAPILTYKLRRLTLLSLPSPALAIARWMLPASSGRASMRWRESE